jgi:hypothetical protein
MVSTGNWDVERHIASVVTLKRKPMGSTTLGDAAPPSGGSVAPQDIEIDRGNSGRVRLSDRA